MPRAFRNGPVGALIDEYERAVDHLVRVVQGLTDDEYERIRDAETSDENCRSIRTILTHVIGAGYGYAGMLRRAWGGEPPERWRRAVARAHVEAELRAMLAYTCATLEGHWDISEDEACAMEIRAAWGQVYDFEQLFEHAIVHVLRHRRQIERFLDTERAAASG